MATGISVVSTAFAAHRRGSCQHHRQIPVRDTCCFGTFKNGERCRFSTARSNHKNIALLPTCNVHMNQMMVASRCQAQLPCGFPCNQLFNWKPHGFQLCDLHCETSMPSYFLAIPREVRLPIYRLLLPERMTTSKVKESKSHWRARIILYTEILRVNKQIHDEATSVLYESSTFSIVNTRDGWAMCKSLEGANTHDIFPSGGNFNFLHQTGGQFAITIPRFRNERPIIQASGTELIRKATFDTKNQLNEPVWAPPLSARYFDMIRFFQVELNLDISANETADHVNFGSAGPQLYDSCDDIHKLIARLHGVRPDAHMQINIKIYHHFSRKEQIYQAVQLLLGPFRRLQNFARLGIGCSTRIDMWRHREAGASETDISAPSAIFDKFLADWRTDWETLEPITKSCEVLKCYWMLAGLIRRISANYRDTEPRFVPFKEMLLMAKVAREARDLEGLARIRDEVFEIWNEFQREQVEFSLEVTRLIEEMNVGELMEGVE